MNFFYSCKLVFNDKPKTRHDFNCGQHNTMIKYIGHCGLSKTEQFTAICGLSNGECLVLNALFVSHLNRCHYE